MAKIVNATCTQSGSKKTTQYGQRIVADFEAPEDDDIAIWEDADSNAGRALLNLTAGQDVTLVRDSEGGSTYYKLEESEQEELLSGSQQSSGGQTQQSNATKKQVAREILSDAERISGLQMEIYGMLRSGFKSREGDVPTPKALAAMTNTAVIQIERNRT